MSTNNPKTSSPHIGIFGKRNAGKSSFINALTNQDIAITSDIAGTTTDPVKKSFEITNLGSVVLIDTAGIDDNGELGEKRVKATFNVLKQIDLGILLFSENSFNTFEENLISEFEKLRVPFLIIHNKSDIETLSPDMYMELKNKYRADIFDFSSKAKDNIQTIFSAINKSLPDSTFNNPSILGDLIKQGDLILLVTPIDIEAPKGRLILPQVQTIRDILDNDSTAIVLKERELDSFLQKHKIKPALVVTDSQVFLKVSASIPSEIPLTSFSILFARLKGHFDAFVDGTKKISNLNDFDKVLILESCSHHVAGDDIGRVKIPRWLTNFTGKKLLFDVVAGLDNPPSPINEYKLVIQCGGCMLTRKQVLNRIIPAIEAGVPVTNYGLAIAYSLGIFERAIQPFRKISDIDYL